MLDIVLILLAAGAVFVVAQRSGFPKGTCVAIALLVSLSPDLDIAPAVTVHRVILAVLVLLWLQAPRGTAVRGRLPFFSILLVILCAHVGSLLISITPSELSVPEPRGSSLKDCIAFVVEILLFYRVVGSTLTTPAAGLAALRALVYGLACVAVVALIERYFRIILPVILFSHFKYLLDGIQSTYPHRILLGYAMAMGMPVALSLLDLAPSKKQKWWMWVVVFLTAAACFLADSRGGWIGMAIGGAISFLFGTAQTRKRCLWVVVLAMATLTFKPGVRDTIVDRYTETLDKGSYKETSYSYRWKLWHVAFSETNKSPERFLFGYGGQSTQGMDLSRYFGHEEGGTAVKIGFTSWDNHYAADLMEFGWVGLGLEIILYAAILLGLLRRWLDAKGAVKGVLGGLIAVCVIYFFAKSNVYIFSAQLNFVFWTVVVVGCVAFRTQAARARLPVRRRVAEPVSVAQ
jgi:O-Antigen ligase